MNDWFDNIRPVEEQQPPLNLDYRTILPLDSITFSMFDGFGAKCTNIATMRTFGFPDGTIPNGFGIPFYYYQEFMKFNNFFQEAELMINDPNFQSDRTIRSNMLKDFRDKIKAATMPQWIWDELTIMQATFPVGTSIRCRSSTNNEDLPGFNGAGLYNSKTQHPDEGHIAKSIKQVYASLWNLRAFEERDFYRVNHFMASMGILCHPNYQDEKANGVGVSTDPVYNTINTFYLNTQVGEDLITNPNAASIPEELLLDRVQENGNDFDYTIVRRSNLIANDSLIIEEYMDEMRDYLSTIHDEFERLYEANGNPNFAMDIEYKITSDDRLIIKQARPWVSYILNEGFANIMDNVNLNLYPNPAQHYITMECEDCTLTGVRLLNILGQPVPMTDVSYVDDSTIQVSFPNLPKGAYVLQGLVANNNRFYSKMFIKQ